MKYLYTCNHNIVEDHIPVATLTTVVNKILLACGTNTNFDQWLLYDHTVLPVNTESVYDTETLNT